MLDVHERCGSSGWLEPHLFSLQVTHIDIRVLFAYNLSNFSCDFQRTGHEQLHFRKKDVSSDFSEDILFLHNSFASSVATAR